MLIVNFVGVVRGFRGPILAASQKSLHLGGADLRGNPPETTDLQIPFVSLSLL